MSLLRQSLAQSDTELPAEATEEVAAATILGQSITILGELQGDENLTVCGQIEGQVTLTQTLHVKETGIVKAEIFVRIAVISGIVVGNITATVSVYLTSTCRMVGNIRAPLVVITAGARIRGEIDMGERKAAAAEADENQIELANVQSQTQLTEPSVVAAQTVRQSAISKPLAPVAPLVLKRLHKNVVVRPKA